jgi:hypothetical protein
MAYTTSEARQELLDTVAQAANELGFASACLAEAYERLDEYNGDRLEAECFRPVGMAYGRAKRTHTDFAVRHGSRQPRSSRNRRAWPLRARPASSPAVSRRLVWPIGPSRTFRIDVAGGSRRRSAACRAQGGSGAARRPARTAAARVKSRETSRRALPQAPISPTDAKFRFPMRLA